MRISYKICLFVCTMNIEANVGGKVENCLKNKSNKSENRWTSQPKIDQVHGDFFSFGHCWSSKTNNSYL